ncbi:hypothetical protein DFH08DRAFT_972499 [Mycena albidolilacea]|uniref:Uncharacterized protein n=1 Tax=Mycena albidolilacea TaxID=1033008 RepID=A0AAD6ZBE9_9AGAR|nr:hypothetical protein DFH08DRAFT_972499 [Mycena albidolilacea]
MPLLRAFFEQQLAVLLALIKANEPTIPPPKVGKILQRTVNLGYTAVGCSLVRDKTEAREQTGELLSTLRELRDAMHTYHDAATQVTRLAEYLHYGTPTDEDQTVPVKAFKAFDAHYAGGASTPIDYNRSTSSSPELFMCNTKCNTYFEIECPLGGHQLGLAYADVLDRVG